MTRKDIFNEVRKIRGSLSDDQVKAGDEIMDKLGEDIVRRLTGMSTAKTILTVEQLKKIYPSANVAFVDVINSIAPKYEITTTKRMAMFLAQVLHESGGFNKLRESLAYTPQRLAQVFPNRFKTVAQAKLVTDKGQVAIGDSIYGGRMGNGKDNGDGYKYRGGGLLHTTGKDNYTIVSKNMNASGVKIDLVSRPEDIVKPEIAVESAMIFWRDNKLNALADKDMITEATKVVNGGTNGLAERKALYSKAIAVL